MNQTLREQWAGMALVLRDRVERLRGNDEVDSLYLVTLDLHMQILDDDVRTIIECLEDCGVG